MSWISVKTEMPPLRSYQDGSTIDVLVQVKRDYAPVIGIASGEWTEDGFVWYFENHMLQNEQPEVMYWQHLPERTK